MIIIFKCNQVLLSVTQPIFHYFIACELAKLCRLWKFNEKAGNCHVEKNPFGFGRILNNLVLTLNNKDFWQGLLNIKVLLYPCLPYEQLI